MQPQQVQDQQKPRETNFNQSKNLVYASYLLITSLSLIAWSSYFKGELGGFAVPSILVLLAFGYMWVHYFSGFLKANFQPDLNTKLSLKISQIFVLAAIIAHPIMITAHLQSKGYGLPPSSYDAFFGSSKKIFIILGSISLFSFLLFEFKRFLKNYPKVWANVLKLNDLAMLLIVIHGLKLGLTINSTWLKYLWLFYGLTLLYFYYDHYINKKHIKRFAEVFIISLVVLMMLFITLTIDIGRNQSSESKINNVQSTQDNTQLSLKDITLGELSSADGINGNKCYIAVNNKIYDASDNSEWKNGQHTPSRGQAKCGNDLTDLIKQSPHGDEVLNQLPTVGNLTGL